MVAVTIITAASLPIYSILFHRLGVVGLAFASDIGIGVNLFALAWLLHYRRLVSLRKLRWDELGKSALTAIVAGAISLQVAKIIPLPLTGHGSRTADLLQLGLIYHHLVRRSRRRTLAAALAIAQRPPPPQGCRLSLGCAGREQGDHGRWHRAIKIPDSVLLTCRCNLLKINPFSGWQDASRASDFA